MQKYRVTGPDGQTVVIEAESPEAAKAEAKRLVKPAPNANPGVDPAAPPDMILNPQTGQYTSRELLTNAMEPSRAQAAQIGGMQGLSFGGADEVMGAASAVTDGAEGYTFGREYTRAAEDAARRDFPWTTGGAEVLGAGATALGYGIPNAARMGMTGLPGSMAGGAVVGTGEGLVYGALSGEGSFRDRAANAIKFGLLGGIGGGVAPVAAELARRGGRVVGDVIGGGADYVLGKGRQGRADRALSATLGRAGMTADDLGGSLMRAAQDGQGEVFAAADALGQAGQRRMSGIVRSGGEASQEIADFLRQRQLDQPERVGAFVREGFDANDTAAKRMADLTAARNAAADTAYATARANASPVNLTPTVETIDGLLNRNPILGDTALESSEIGKRLMRLRGQMQAGGEQLIDFDQVLNIKQDLGGQIEALRSSGKSVPPELAKVYGELDAALEASSNAYRAANDGFREASRVIDAVDEGADMLRPGARYEDTTARFNAMTPEQQAAARVGYGDRTLARIEASAGEMTNRARPLTSTKVRNEAAAMTTDPALFQRRVGREMTMHDTMQRALGGSRTADNLEDIADLKSYDTGMLLNILTGQWRTAGAQAMQGASNALTGMSPETRRIVAQALMARDETAFRKAIASAQTGDARREVADALLRITAQRTGYAGSVQP